MAEVFEWVSAALSGVTLLIAILIVVLARRSLAAVALAVYLSTWALSGFSGPVVGALGGERALAFKWSWILQLCGSAAGLLAFAVVYPNVYLSRARQAVLMAIGMAAVAGAVFILASPDVWWFDPTTGATAATPVAGALLGTFGAAIPMFLLGRRWLTRTPDTYRTQIAWGILPIAWWTLHDGLGYVIYPRLLGVRDPMESRGLLFDALTLLIVAGVAFVLVLMVVALSRTFRGRGAGDDRALGFVLLYMLPVTLVQVVLPSHGPGPPASHLLLDYAVAPLAVYGVLRHRVVDIDIKLRHGLKRSTVAATFVAVFFVGSTIAQEFLADSFGWLLGGVAAGLLIFALAPIQRVADRLSTAALPHARADAGYLAYRRYQIYKAALEGTVADGVVDPLENAALRRLRDELGITLDDHDLLQGEVRGARVAVA